MPSKKESGFIGWCANIKCGTPVKISKREVKLNKNELLQGVLCAKCSKQAKEHGYRRLLDK